ncbi:inverse autotransporter beta domain-containing protein [Neorickettsia sennetsu]|uniref:Inverse autotransporter beta-domain domain-containing protein n=1 Tax=Ehrlichia sennetsu (strain ATCC VR-367 / Miyayama) TaxID=222891 RepID=Q2GDV5_EHRS3|nr:inverse autotransporter beta-barrel domain-containing protein [Neorickettsia sennetsu]ABD45917.1 hypothetical protein NSE_0456 [Neorickettsia sennetsu str. Miyayama]
MKNFRSVSKARLLFFLSGFCLVVPTALDASNLKNYDKSVTEGGYSEEKGVYYKKVAATGLLNKVGTTFSGLRNSKISDEKRFVDREGNAIQFNCTPHDSRGDSLQSAIQAGKSQGRVSELARNLPQAERSTLNAYRVNVFAPEKVVTQSDLNNTSRHTVGARFTVTNEFSDSNGGAVSMSEFGALLPLLSKVDNLIYIDLKSKLYDAKEGEVSTGIVFRRQMSPLLTGGINVFTDVRFLPEGNYRWYSLGGEIFFKSFSLNGNYYRSNKKTTISSVKSFEFHDPDPGKAVIVLDERAAGNGYDLGLGLTLNKYINIHGSAFFFYSPYNTEEKFSGYRAGVDLSLYLNERFSVLVSPEFVADSKRNRFLVNVGFNLPVGRDYTRLLGHVRRDRDIVLFDTNNSYNVNSAFLVADKEYQVGKLIKFSPNDQDAIKKLTNKTENPSASTAAKNEESKVGLDLFLIRDAEKSKEVSSEGVNSKEISLTEGAKELMLSDETTLKVYIPYSGGERIVNYFIPKSEVTIKLGGKDQSDSTGTTYKSLLFNGARVELDDPTKYTMEDVTFNSCFVSSNKERPFQDDKGVLLMNSKLEFSHDNLKSAFYSTKSDTKDERPVVSYILKNVHIELPKVVHDPKNPVKDDFKALFTGDLDKMGKIDVKLAGEIKVDTKTSIDARKKAEEEVKAPVSEGKGSGEASSAA